MRNFILFFLILNLSACCHKPIPCNHVPVPCDTSRNTVVVPVLDFQIVDSLLAIQDSIMKENDSLRAVSDTLARRLLHSRLVISNVKYYLDICLRNPSQDKFLKGWIRRAVE